MLARIKRGIEVLKRNDKVLLVSHYDCDGLASAAIMSKAMERNGTKFSPLIIKEIDDESIKKIIDYNLPVIFSDIGSNPLIEKINNQIIILDHHEPVNFNKDNIVEINPELFGIHELSGSGICYLFAKAMNEKNKDLSYIALVGAIGDMVTENYELTGENKKIVKDAKDLGLIRAEKGLKIYGHDSRPIHKALEYSSEIGVPKVSKNESSVVQFLSDLNIKIKDGDKFRRLSDLSEQEKIRLHTALVMEKIANGENPEEIFGTNYFLTKYNFELKEFATIVNAFGRLERYGEGIEFCLNPTKEKADDILKTYRGMMGKFIAWAKQNIVESDGIGYIIARDKIHANFISPVTTIFSNALSVKILVGMAYADNKIKISVRNKTNIDMANVLNNIATALGGFGGGHKEACGATIPKDEEERFIKLFNESIKV